RSPRRSAERRTGPRSRGPRSGSAPSIRGAVTWVMPAMPHEDRFRVQLDAEALAHPGRDPPRERDELRGGRAAAVDERQRVLGRDANVAALVALVEAGALD